LFNSSVKGFDDNLFAETTKAIEALPKQLSDAALEAGVFLESKLNTIYATAPARDDSLFVWSLNPTLNRKAQKWWFANLRKGNIPTNGKHYSRQGQPPYSVVLNVDEKNGTVFFQITMQDKRMKWVFGTLNGIDSRNPSHKSTGWNFAYPLLEDAITETNVMLLNATLAYLEAI